MLSVYADGGVITKNPSTYGGTWACIMVTQIGDADQFELHSGLVTPAQIGLPTVSNNYTELLACVESMERLPDRWDGVLHTDSNVTRIRLVYPRAKLNGIPNGLRERLADQRKRLGSFTVVLLSGHPTREQLRTGIGKHNLPVSRWNVECDKECNRLANTFRSQLCREHA